MWLSLQLDRKKKVMLKLAQQLNHAELHKLDTEVHNDCTVYGFSLCYAFVKPCKKYPCLLDPDWYHRIFPAVTALGAPDWKPTRKRSSYPFVATSLCQTHLLPWVASDGVTCSSYHSEGTVHGAAWTSKSTGWRRKPVKPNVESKNTENNWGKPEGGGGN